MMLACTAALVVSASAAGSLTIYFIDVEGGQATLVKTAAGQTLLIDAGFPGTGTFQSTSGDPAQARDAQRVLAAARDAGVTTIDYLLVTHFHADHMGGVPELAQLLPIGTFVDHGTVPAKAEESVPGTLAAFQRYAAARAKGRHLEPKPGDRILIQSLTATIVSASGATLSTSMTRAVTATPSCPSATPVAEEPNENPNSTGILLEFGKFRFLDVGDLSGAPLHDLACPTSRVGPVDLYLVAHHGGTDAAQPSTFASFAPRVAVFNNGPKKGGAAATLAAAHQTAGLDVWQLHRSLQPNAENFPDDRIVNLDETGAYWLKVSAQEDGSFVVANARTGQTKTYPAR